MAINLLLRDSECLHPLIVIDGDIPANHALATIAHEAAHALDYIIEFIGMDDRSGEFRAHGIAEIMRQTTKVILGDVIKKKKHYHRLPFVLNESNIFVP